MAYLMQEIVQIIWFNFVWNGLSSIISHWFASNTFQSIFFAPKRIVRVHYFDVTLNIFHNDLFRSNKWNGLYLFEIVLMSNAHILISVRYYRTSCYNECNNEIDIAWMVANVRMPLIQLFHQFDPKCWRQSKLIKFPRIIYIYQQQSTWHHHTVHDYV